MPDLDSPKSPPVGTIQVWSGLLDDIPSKWRLCDGTNGTPNLIAKFVKGAPPDIDAGATGGEDQVTLTTNQLPNHDHSIGSIPSHDHDVNIIGGTGPSVFGMLEGNQDEGNFQWDLRPSGISIQSEGGGNAHENRPPYFEVAYIMRVEK